MGERSRIAKRWLPNPISTGDGAVLLMMVTAPVRSSSNVPYNRCKVRWNRLVSDEKQLAFCGRIDGLYRGSSYGPGASNCLAQVSGCSALPTVEVPGSFSAVDCVRRVPG